LYNRIAPTNSYNTAGGPYKNTTTGERLESQTVTFRDDTTEWRTGFNETSDPTRDVTYDGDVQLGDFFARPLPIKNYTWTPGTTWTNVAFDPWTLYITNPRVANRMSNYQNFSGKVCLKFMINGNAFYYGRLMVYYQPTPNMDLGRQITVGNGAKMMNSQRLKIFIDPCQSQAGTMCLPFIWPFDKASLVEGTDIASLGTVQIMALNELKHANAATSPLTITIYAWMEDVKLSMPTSSNIIGLVAQGGKDEYGDSPISSMATAVSKASGKLAGVPMIGPYARATEVATGVMAAAAKAMGFSRPAAIEQPTLVRPRYVGELAVTDVADTVAKLTIDSKQELAVGSDSIGIDSGDELLIKSIATRESYCTTFTWATSSVANTVLLSARVTPMHVALTTTTPQHYFVTACAFASLPFKFWKGTMRYRFQIVCSEYHKGRLLIVWDPVRGTTIPEQNVAYSKIVDIGAEKDFVLDVAWGLPKAWGQLVAPAPTMQANGLPYTISSGGAANGVLTVYVLNELTSPNSSINNDIQVNVFHSMCEDAQFAMPNDVLSTYARWKGQGVTPQSGEDNLGEGSNAPNDESSDETIATCLPTSDSSSLVYFGETISSMRQLMKRYNFVWNVSLVPTASSSLLWTSTDFPLDRGYDTRGLRTGTTANYNPVNTCILSYLSWAFLYFKGGVRHKYFYSNNGVINTHNSYISTNRVVGDGLSANYGPPTNPTYTTTTQITIEDGLMALKPSGMQGMHVAPLARQPVLEVEYPFYNQARFVGTRQDYASSITQPMVTGTSHTVSIVGLTAIAMCLEQYIAAAEDASFFCFQGCMPFQVYPTFS